MTSRRSPPRNPQIHFSEEGSEMSRHRCPRPDLQIHSSDEDAGVACCCSPRLHPKIQANEDGAGVIRRRGTSPGASASLPDDDDMLREILLRLPPQPSSLLRASAVCKRWRFIIRDRKFHLQFYAHHQKPPLLGVFKYSNQGIVFTPMLDPPDRIPPQRFNFGPHSGREDYGLLDCHHGLVLLKDRVRNEVVVFYPINGEQRRVPVPQVFKRGYIDGAVLCDISDLGHVHGGCHSSPFKVVLCTKDNQKIACVYSSQNGIWGNLITTEVSCVLSGNPAVLVGNCLYWLSMTSDILEFNLDENNFTEISGPPVANGTFYENWQIIQVEDGVVGYAIFCYPNIHIWQRSVNDHGADTWVLLKTIEMRSILKLPPQTEGAMSWIQTLGYNEDSGVIFLCAHDTIYTIQLMSMQSRKLWGNHQFNYYYPFASFYTPAIREGDEGDMSHDP